MAETLQIGAWEERREDLGEVWRRKRRPADDARDGWRPGSQLEQPASLVHGPAGLHGNGRVDAADLHDGYQVGQQEVAAQRNQRTLEPVEVLGVVAPEVVVCVDGAGHGV